MSQQVVFPPDDRRVWMAVLAGMSVLLVGVTVLTWSRYGAGLLAHSLTVMAQDAFVLYAMFDFVVLLALVSWWTVRDARRRGIAAWYWIVAYYLLGTIGVVGYLLYSQRRPPVTTA